MKVSEMLNKIEYLKNLRTDVKVINDKHIKMFDTDDTNTLEDAADAIAEYIDELLRKDVKI